MSNKQKIHIKEFDPEMIKPSLKKINDIEHGSMKIVIIARPGSGKSFLVADLLYSKRHIFPVGSVISGTEDSNGFYKKILPDSFIYNKLEDRVVENFIKRQKIAKKYLANPWGVLVMDDVSDDPKLLSRPLFQSIVKNSRQWSMLFILILQYAMDVKPTIRTSLDVIFIFREGNLKTRKSLWENYASIVPDFDIFCQLMDQLTEDYHCLVIYNQLQTNDWTECVFWYRAKKVPENWKFGSNDYWEFHNQRYNTNYVEPLI